MGTILYQSREAREDSVTVGVQADTLHNLKPTQTWEMKMNGPPRCGRKNQKDFCPLVMQTLIYTQL